MKNKILKLFSFKRHDIVKVILPVEYVRKMEYIYLTIYKNSIGILELTTFMFYIGLDVFYELLSKHKVKSFMEMIKISYYIRNTVKEYVINSNENTVLIPLKYYHVIRDLFDVHNIYDKDVIDFYNFVNNNKQILLNNKIIIDKDDILMLFNIYINKKNKKRFKQDKLKC